MDKNKRGIDKSLYNEKSLYLLNIKELRDIGRKFGVPSPTTMKKQELIDFILKIVYGEIEAPVRTNFGRPNVREFDMNHYVEKIKKNADITDELLKVKLNPFLSLGVQEVAAPKQEVFDNIENRVYFEDGEKCYLRVYEFVPSSKDIEISKDYAEKLGLENLDVLEVRIEENMFKIITINGVAIDNKFKDFEVDNEKIEGGKRKVFYLRTKEEIDNNIEEIAIGCQERGLKLLIFAEKNHTVKCDELMIYNKSEGYPKMYKNFMKLVSLCEKYVFDSEDVVVILENAIDIEDMFDSFDDDVNARAQTNIKQLAKKFLALGNTYITYRIEKPVLY